MPKSGTSKKTEKPKQAKPAAKPPAPPERLFEDTCLALCVVDSLVDQGLIETEIKIPVHAPLDEDDYFGEDGELDESESWRDNLDTNQDESIEKLVALLATHRAKLPKLKELHGAMICIAEFDAYEPDVYSLAGIDLCTGLESIQIWSTEKKLDLSPLAKLPKLATIDLGCASTVDPAQLLELELPALRTVIGAHLHPRMIEALKKRGVAVKAKS